ncbi:MAG TPA: hypothetical protein DIU15_17455 [Deltaproteobacteria bacterium]|nr:hypothetical protein [Deltaproteobacteria bacterium]HCP47831.1 hypothetical protein [Deltaproteobacteria bacterium]
MFDLFLGYARRVASSLATLALLLALGGCDLGLFDDDGAGFLVGTDAGKVFHLIGGDSQASFGWEADIAASSKVVMDGSGDDILVGSGQEVVALSAMTGESLWGQPVSLGDDVVAVAGPLSGVAIVMTLEPFLVGIDMADGSELWRLDLLLSGNASDDAVAVGSSGVFLGGTEILKLDPQTGAEQAYYNTGTGSSYVVDIQVAGGTVYAGLEDGVVALSASTLSEEWRHPTADEVDNVSVGGSSVFYSVIGGGVGALTQLGGNLVGEAEDGSVFEALSVGGNLLLAARSDGTLLAYDEADMAEVWTIDGAAGAAVRDLVTSGDTIFYAAGSYVDGINLSDGSSLWSYDPSGNPSDLFLF